MNPDPRESLPREILEELMEEGAQAFRSVLEKLVNLAMELERSEFLGAEPCERTRERREISATQVSRIAKVLDEELEQFRNRELGAYRVMYLDAHYEKVRVHGTVQDLAILKAIGINRWGKREVLGVSATLSEAEVHWREFLQSLQRRGLKGVERVVSDDHVGLRAARRAVWPSVPWQRCQVHLAQNAQAHAHNRQQAREMGQAIRDIFNSPSLADAETM